MKFIELVGNEEEELKEALKVYGNYYRTQSSTFVNMLTPKQHKLLKFTLENPVAGKTLAPLQLYLELPSIMKQLRDYRTASLIVKLNYILEHEIDSNTIQYLNEEEKQAITKLLKEYRTKLERDGTLPTDRKQFFDLVQAFLT
jgi:hypothetical protein